jgi:hypothetical protein
MEALTWRKLRELIDKIPEDALDQTVVINDGGSETYASELVIEKFPYMKGF